MKNLEDDKIYYPSRPYGVLLLGVILFLLLLSLANSQILRALYFLPLLIILVLAYPSLALFYKGIAFREDSLVVHRLFPPFKKTKKYPYGEIQTSRKAVDSLSFSPGPKTLVAFFPYGAVFRIDLKDDQHVSFYTFHETPTLSNFITGHDLARKLRNKLERGLV